MNEFFERVAVIRHLQIELMMDYPLTVIIPLTFAAIAYWLAWRYK